MLRDRNIGTIHRAPSLENTQYVELSLIINYEQKLKNNRKYLSKVIRLRLTQTRAFGQQVSSSDLIFSPAKTNQNTMTTSRINCQLTLEKQFEINEQLVNSENILRKWLKQRDKCLPLKL